MAKMNVDIASRVKSIIEGAGKTPTDHTLNVAAGRTSTVLSPGMDTDDDDDEGDPTRLTGASGGGANVPPVKTLDPDADLDEDDEDEDQPTTPTKEGEEPGDQPPAESAKPGAPAANASMLEQMAAMQAELKKYKDAETRQSLIDKYVANGYDTDTASEMADNKLDGQRMREELDTLRALGKYRKTFAMYGVEDKGEELISLAKAANLAPDEYCRKVYGGREPGSVTRARASARGEVTEEDVPRTPASNSSSSVKLTARDREIIEDMRANGIPVDEKSYLARKQAKAKRG